MAILGNNFIEKRRGYLNAFIKTYGKIPPTDWRDFIIDNSSAPYMHLCFLCGWPHNYGKDIRFRDVRTQETNTVCACRDCGDSIEQSIVIPQKEYGTIKKKDGTWELKKATKAKIDMFFKHNISPSDYPIFCQTGAREFNCLFCWRSAFNHMAKKRSMPIRIPVDTRSNKIVGDAKMCGGCCKYAAEQGYLTNGHAPAVGTYGQIVDLCHDCGYTYPITDTEYEAREAFGTVGQHLCADCLEKDGLLGELRNISVTCYSKNCLNHVLIDKTMARKHTDKVICSDCRSNQYFNYKMVYTIGEDDDIQVLIGKITDGNHRKGKVKTRWHYQLVMEESIVFAISERGWKTMAKAAFHGVREGKALWRKRIYEMKQKQKKLNL